MRDGNQKRWAVQPFSFAARKVDGGAGSTIHPEFAESGCSFSIEVADCQRVSNTFNCSIVDRRSVGKSSKYRR